MLDAITTVARWRVWLSSAPLLVLVLGCATGGAATSDRANTADRVSSTSETAGNQFALRPPAGWVDITVMGKARDARTLLLFSRADGASFRVTQADQTWLRTVEISTDQMQVFITRVLDTLTDRFGRDNVRLLSVGGTQLSNLAGSSIDFTITQGEHVTRLRQSYVLHERNLVAATMAAPIGRWASAAPDLELLRMALGRSIQGAPPPPVIPHEAARLSSRPGGTVESRHLYASSFAVVIGIDRYEQPALRLRYAVNDAQSVQQALQRFGFPNENITSLLDGQATKRRIQEVLGDELRRRTARDDRVFIFFAGHGVTVDLPAGGQMGYLLPVDADPERIHGTALSMSELRDISNLLPAKHVFFAVDACYSGLAAQRSIAVQPISRVNTDELVRGRLRLILTAGDRDEPVVEQAGHGVFTRYLIAGLAGEADFAPKDGLITGFELASWLVPRVHIETGGRQTPFFGRMDGVGDFVFMVP